MLMKICKRLHIGNYETSTDKELDEKIKKLLSELDEFMNDDFSTAKVLANMFEIVPVINSLKDHVIEKDAISSATVQRMKDEFMVFLENILGLRACHSKQ